MGWGSLTRRGGGRKFSRPSSKVFFPWVSKEGTWNIPGILLRCPGPLVAPYRAIPRDYLSDTPLLYTMGSLGVSAWPIGCDTPSPFSERFPLGEHAKWRCDNPPPPQKGYLSDTCAIPYENKATACDTPLCDTISKGYRAIWRGISHWAAKPGPPGGVQEVCARKRLCSFSRNIPVATTTKIFPKVLRYEWEAYCNANWRRTAIQMGGVLTVVPFPQSAGALEAYCNTTWRCVAILF